MKIKIAAHVKTPYIPFLVQIWHAYPIIKTKHKISKNPTIPSLSTYGKMLSYKNQENPLTSAWGEHLTVRCMHRRMDGKTEKQGQSEKIHFSRARGPKKKIFKVIKLLECSTKKNCKKQNKWCLQLKRLLREKVITCMLCRKIMAVLV